MEEAGFLTYSDQYTTVDNYLDVIYTVYVAGHDQTTQLKMESLRRAAGRILSLFLYLFPNKPWRRHCLNHVHHTPTLSLPWKPQSVSLRDLGLPAISKEHPLGVCSCRKHPHRGHEGEDDTHLLSRSSPHITAAIDDTNKAGGGVPVKSKAEFWGVCPSGPGAAVSCGTSRLQTRPAAVSPSVVNHVLTETDGFPGC